MSTAYERFLNFKKKRGLGMRILSWLKKYWYVPVFILGSVLLWLLFRRSGPPLEQTMAEVKAIQAEADVKKLKKALGTEYAKKAVTERYETELKELNEKQEKQAKKLENDPAKLAKFLVRASSKPARS